VAREADDPGHGAVTNQAIASLAEKCLATSSLPEMRERLIEVLRALLEDRAHFLVIDVDKSAKYYVQFLPVDGGGLLCEAVSNEFLSGTDRLTTHDEQNMIDLGWASPDPNFKQLWDAPVPVHVVADRLVATLTRVYRLQDPSSLTVTIGPRKGGPALPADVDVKGRTDLLAIDEPAAPSESLRLKVMKGQAPNESTDSDDVVPAWDAPFDYGGHDTQDGEGESGDTINVWTAPELTVDEDEEIDLSPDYTDEQLAELTKWTSGDDDADDKDD
jgi:hypothetical protein